ncbi:MAG: hypothetical protein CM15mP92_1650 [Halieaceae bacterium]|nr:MAG: hypothetical protein CM15mP92_1650 [Halieaceae bacterium]
MRADENDAPASADRRAKFRSTAVAGTAPPALRAHSVTRSPSRAAHAAAHRW